MGVPSVKCQKKAVLDCQGGVSLDHPLLELLDLLYLNFCAGVIRTKMAVLGSLILSQADGAK